MSSETTKTVWAATPAKGSTSASLTVQTIEGGDSDGSHKPPKKNFFAKGVCYQAVPWGGSANWPPYGDFLSSPWNEVWERDLNVLRPGGVNLLRTYNMPLTQAGATHDHKAALKACWNGGTDPIYVLMGFGVLNELKDYDPWSGGASYRAAATAVFQATVDKYKDDPAVMGFIIGNEVNNSNTIADSKFWSHLDGLAKYVKDNAPDKLSVMCLVDDSMDSVKDGDSQMPHLDVWGINSYRGNDQSGTNNFTNLWSSFQAASNKPLLVSEWGAPASGHGTNGTLVFNTLVTAGLDTYITGHYTDILNNAVTTTSNGGSSNPNSANWAPVCIGSSYFEWSDELWKMDADYPNATCPATEQNPGVQTNPNFPGGWDDEECFGLNAVTPVDYTDPKTGKTIKPKDRPGQKPGDCPGAWNFSLSQPYPADTLTPRKSWTTLSGIFTS